MLVYVSGPFMAETQDGILANIDQAGDIGLKLTKMGHSVIVPHMNSAYRTLLHMDDSGMSWEKWLLADEMVIARCDAIVMTQDWERSPGATRENYYATQLGIPIYVYPDLPPLHPTEVKCPQQAKAFAEIVGEMYRTHLSKNHDYSPANILATGSKGVFVRLWDKVARFLNLTGYPVEVDYNETIVAMRLLLDIEALLQRAGYNVQMRVKPSAVRSPKHESINDTLMDMAVYAIIGLLLRRNQWGK